MIAAGPDAPQVPPAAAARGLRLVEGVVGEDTERELLAWIEAHPGPWERPRLRPGLPEANREMLCFGWDYVTQGRGLREGAPIPPLLATTRDDCAKAAGLDPSPFEQLIVTRYRPGAGINWHTDAPVFGPVVMTLSLGSDWRMDFNECGTRPDFRVPLPRRSLLVLAGEARTALRHRIPQVKALRHSISLRTIRTRDDG